jgi:hypothetical protein
LLGSFGVWIWPRSECPPYLRSVLAIKKSDPNLTYCGSKLVDFARSLAREGALDTPQEWTRERLIRLMLKALDSKGLSIRKSRHHNGRYVVSSEDFAARTGLKVRVDLGAPIKRRPGMPLGPTDLVKMKAAEDQQKLRTLRKDLSHALVAKTEAEGAAEERRVKLVSAREVLRDQEQTVSELKTDLDDARKVVGNQNATISELRAELTNARSTIQSQQKKLAATINRTTGLPYHRVGLDPACPDFLLKYVRTAYRKQLHPDPRPTHEKAEAERQFKEAEEVFDKLFTARGLV